MTLIQQVFQPVPTPSETEANEHLFQTEVHNRLARIDVRSLEGSPLSASFEHRDLGDLLITDWDLSAIAGFRSPQAANRDVDALLLFTASAGSQIIETGEEEMVLHPGRFLIMSTRTTAKFIVPEKLKKRSVRIPLSALSPYDTGRGIPERLILDIGHNPLAGLTRDYLAGVQSHIDEMSPAEIEGARNALLVLVAGLIRAAQTADVGENDFLPFLRQKLEAWIEEHLSSGPIRVRHLAAAHNVSTRTVHRAFAATGDTVGSVVRARRISAARSDLVNTTRSIAGIAHRWGFSDASHLGREFRREFSASPGNYRDAHSIT